MDGRKVSQSILSDLRVEVEELARAGVHPKLAVILVGDNAASLSYIRQKHKACEATGILWEQFDFDKSVTEEELIAKIEELNSDMAVHGILVQLPLG